MNNLGALFEARGEMKVRSFSRLAFESNLAPHLLDQFGRNHEAEPGAAEAAAGRSLRLDKRLEKAPRASNGIPIPVSITSKRTIASSLASATFVARTVTSPRSVNLIAFATRLL